MVWYESVIKFLTENWGFVLLVAFMVFLFVWNRIQKKKNPEKYKYKQVISNYVGPNKEYVYIDLNNTQIKEALQEIINLENDGYTADTPINQTFPNDPFIILKKVGDKYE